MKWYNGEYFVSDQKSVIDLSRTSMMLNTAPWAKERDLTTIKISIQNSFCFSLFHYDQQIGFGRVITDFSTYAIFFDVIIEKDSRGKGLGSWLFETMTKHPLLKDLKQVLWTSDAVDFYRKHGFSPAKEKPTVMFKNYPFPGDNP